MLPTLDGMDDGLWVLGALEARGVIVLNDAASLMATHDKLLTARLLRRSGVAHPATGHVRNGRQLPPIERPVVVKPRFGSWGREVYRCEDQAELETAIEQVRPTSLVRAARRARAGSRAAAGLRPARASSRPTGWSAQLSGSRRPGEWRTNIALGGVRRPVPEPPLEAGEIARDAARASGATLVGVDLLPVGDGGWVVVELNGAVEFTREYAPWSDVFVETAAVLAEEARETHAARPRERRQESDPV